MLSQLSYSPVLLEDSLPTSALPTWGGWVGVREGRRVVLLRVGLARLELATSRLSSVRSNQLSYRPLFDRGLCPAPSLRFKELSKRQRASSSVAEN